MPADFFARLPAVPRFAALADPDAYAPAPDDWTLILTDVVGSTEAVRAGRYRDVNYVGAASIAAVLNASHRADLPFVFGGDGATLLVPPEHLPASLRALATLQDHAGVRLGLPLRVGAVPLAAIRRAGREVAVARLQVTDRYAQALFRGGGVEWAERQVKSPATAGRYANRAEPCEDEDPYAGLECRWQDVQSPRGETVSLLVEAVGDDTGATYREVLGAIEALYGHGHAARPITLDQLRLSARPSKLSPEAKLRHPDDRLRYQAGMWALNLLGRALIRFGAQTAETDWEVYPKRVLDSTDYRKFDGVLRMVLAGGAAERERLEATLERLHRAGRLAYGLHVTDRAVLTCIVYERMGSQVHFVDGAGGGYTNAAVGFKRRRKALAQTAAQGRGGD